VTEEKKPSRNLQGRWVKGVSGNPDGRPHKFAKIDTGNLEYFMNTVREVNTPDGRVVMTREAAVQHRLYQSAMQGNVYAQIFLARRFDKYNENKAELDAKLKRLLANLRETEREPTDAEMEWMATAAEILRYLPRPNEKPPKKRRSRRKARSSEGGSDTGPES
jgi:hypothetical protein